VLDNLSTGKLENIEYLWEKFGKQKLEFVKGDVADKKSFEELDGKLKNKKGKEVGGIDAIVHLAAIVSVPQSVADPAETNRVTLGGTINMFEFARANNIKKVVQASSAAIYGEVKKFPIKESYASGFISPYAIAKYASELYADYHDKVFGIKTISFRFFNVYGERQDPKGMYSGVIAKFVEAFRNKSEINIFGNGKNTRDFIYVKDVSETICSLVTSETFPQKSNVYNLGTGQETSLLQMLKTLEKIFGYKVKINFLPTRAGDIKKSVADISKIKKGLKFRPKFTLEQGLEKLIRG
jgi:UDP-glucose 4-epimerase